MRVEFWSTSCITGVFHFVINKIDEYKTNLLLYQRQLFEVSLQKGHLLLLGLAITIADDVIVLFFDFIELNFKLYDLQFDVLED